MYKSGNAGVGQITWRRMMMMVGYCVYVCSRFSNDGMKIVLLVTTCAACAACAGLI